MINVSVGLPVGIPVATSSPVGLDVGIPLLKASPVELDVGDPVSFSIPPLLVGLEVGKRCDSVDIFTCWT